MQASKASIRPWVLIGFFAVLIFCLTGELTVATAQCKCMIGPAPRFNRSYHVFVAAVVKVNSAAAIRNGKKFDEIDFKVRTSWKRDITENVKLFARTDRAEPFKVGEEWLIFADKATDGSLLLREHCCSWVKPLEESRKAGEYDQISQFAKTTKNIQP